MLPQNMDYKFVKNLIILIPTMAKQNRRKFSPEYKARVALEAAKEQRIFYDLAKKYDFSPMVFSHWKAEFLSNMAAAFNDIQSQKTNRRMWILRSYRFKSGNSKLRMTS